MSNRMQFRGSIILWDRHEQRKGLGVQSPKELRFVPRPRIRPVVNSVAGEKVNILTSNPHLVGGSSPDHLSSNLEILPSESK